MSQDPGGWIRRVAARWMPQHVRGHLAPLAIALNLIPAVLAVAIWVLLDPVSDWSEGALLLTLAAIAILASAAEVRLEADSVAFFDPGIVLAMLALAVAGPLPALVIWSIPAAISVAVRRRVPPLSPGVVVTITGYAFGALASAGLLALAGSQSAPLTAAAILGAGVLMWFVSFVFAGLLYAPAYDGQRVRDLVRFELLDLAPGVAGMLALGALSWLAVEAIGPLGLIPLALAVLLPGAAFAAATAARSVSRLSAVQATSLYTAAIADELGFGRRERRILGHAASLPVSDPPVGISALNRALAGWITVLGASLRGEESVEMGEARVIVMRTHEPWDLWPAPRGSRVLSCARAWAELTTGKAQLSHARALENLRGRAGDEFDPEVVGAVERIVAREATLSPGADFQPRLHRIPLPRPVRRVAIPRLLATASPAS